MPGRAWMRHLRSWAPACLLLVAHQGTGAFAVRASQPESVAAASPQQDESDSPHHPAFVPGKTSTSESQQSDVPARSIEEPAADPSGSQRAIDWESRWWHFPLMLLTLAVLLVWRWVLRRQQQT